MQKLQSIIAAHAAEVELIREQSAILIQKRKDGFNGEMHSSGALVENYAKALLKKHLPAGFRICSGYIATTETFFDSSNHLQHDILIVDDRVPPLYQFGISDIEVVPAEAVCGIFEVKRTLTKDSVAQAVKHLTKTFEMLEAYDHGIKSKHRSATNLVGPTFTVTTAAPIYGIIGLAADDDIAQPLHFLNALAPAIEKFIDLIWAPGAPLVAGYRLQTSAGQQCMATMTSRNQPPYLPGCFMEGLSVNSVPDGMLDKELQGRVHHLALCCFRTWISQSSGLILSPEKNMKYFGIISHDAQVQYVNP